MSLKIKEYIPNKIYIVEYPVRFAGMDILARMTLIRLGDNKLWVHNAAPLDDELKNQIDQLGHVAYILAPGTYHHLHIPEFQNHYPEAETFFCPGLEQKRSDIEFDWILGNRPDHRWQDEFDQVAVTGARFISEVVFYHIPSNTLLLVDLLENYGDDYEHQADSLLKFWWKNITRMWNKAAPAPEYQMGWGEKKAVRRSLNKILTWDFKRIIIAHGNIIESYAKDTALKAWKNVLEN